MQPKDLFSYEKPITVSFGGTVYPAKASWQIIDGKKTAVAACHKQGSGMRDSQHDIALVVLKESMNYAGKFHAEFGVKAFLRREPTQADWQKLIDRLATERAEFERIRAFNESLGITYR